VKNGQLEDGGECSHLLVTFTDGPSKTEMVRKSLAAGTLPDAHNAVLLRVDHHALLAHGLRVGNRRSKVAVPVEAPVQTGPMIVAVPSVREAPRNECRVLGLVAHSTVACRAMSSLR
jgi:hypothetical protein